MKRNDSEPDFLSTLQTSRPSADKAFVDALKYKLHTQAETVLTGPNVSRLTHLFIYMRKYSLAYTAALLLIAITGILMFPRGLSAEDVLAKASEVYNSTDGIHYEKTLHQRFENDVLQESSLEEKYYDSLGNYLWVVRNPDTNEIIQVSMWVEDKNGGMLEYMSESIAPQEELSEWDKTYEGPKVVCVKTANEANQTFAASLIMAEEDYSVYTTSGESHDLDQSAEEDPLQVLGDRTLPKETVKAYLNELSENGSYHYSKKNEDGVSYYVFEKDQLLPEEEDRSVAYYFNAETYKLDKQTLTFGNDPGHYELTTYLEDETYPASEAESIFNPANYDVIQVGSIEAGAPDYATENGCYKDEIKLSAEDEANLMQQIPSEALADWDHSFEMMLNLPTDTFEEEVVPEEPIEILEDTSGLPALSLILPTIGTITQNFHEGHYGIDWANRAKPDVVAAADGTVTEVSQGTWNNGSGNSIWIDLGNGYSMGYTHLDTIDVKVGDTVKQGTVLGTMGNSGRVYGATGIHLHFELEYEGKKLDPLPYIE